MIAYHGTPNPEQVLRDGLLAERGDGPSPCVWLACDPGDAAGFGSVIEVELDGLEGGWPGDSWQAHYAGDIGPERLRLIEFAGPVRNVAGSR